MKVVGFAGFSGSGKTTLVEQLIPALRLRGFSASVVKHAHHRFDIDQPGKDTYRHREAGAMEVLIASDRRWALMHEQPVPTPPQIGLLLQQLDAGVDWVLVEGFKDSTLPKIEVWRQPTAHEPPRPVRYPHDPHIVALATDDPSRLPAAVPALLPVLDLNAPDALADWLVACSARFAYPCP